MIQCDASGMMGSILFIMQKTGDYMINLLRVAVVIVAVVIFLLVMAILGNLAVGEMSLVIPEVFGLVIAVAVLVLLLISIRKKGQ